MESINLARKLESFSEHWKPKIIAEVNDVLVKVAKFQGDFVWHSHENEDELFYVVRGTMRLKLRDREIVLNPGELAVVPRGVEHCPFAEEEVHVMMVEPRSTLNTGNVRNTRTLDELDRI